MRITLNELRNREPSAIDLLEILSLEGQQYMARIHSQGKLWLLSDDNGRTRLFRSSWQVQDTLGALEIRETQVVHPSAYHEMVGMEASRVEPMRIKIQGQAS
ncbi:MAG TPA: DUF6482 family protein [Marinobacter sp.]|nr:DUF6482 family protein [Marinobacter sp.]